MKIRKIRGQRRLYRKLPTWLEDYQSLSPYRDLANTRGYAKLTFGPWGGFNMANSHCPPPTGKIKKEFERGLLAIFESWYDQLRSIENDFYLAIWYFEHDVSQSQVVFATGEQQDFYQRIFEPRDITRKFPYTFASGFKVDKTELTWQTCWESQPVFTPLENELALTFRKRSVWLGQIMDKKWGRVNGSRSCDVGPVKKTV